MAGKVANAEGKRSFGRVGGLRKSAVESVFIILRVCCQFLDRFGVKASWFLLSQFPLYAFTASQQLTTVFILHTGRLKKVMSELDDAAIAHTILRRLDAYGEHLSTCGRFARFIKRLQLKVFLKKTSPVTNNRAEQIVKDMKVLVKGEEWNRVYNELHTTYVVKAGKNDPKSRGKRHSEQLTKSRTTSLFDSTQSDDCSDDAGKTNDSIQKKISATSLEKYCLCSKCGTYIKMAGTEIGTTWSNHEKSNGDTNNVKNTITNSFNNFTCIKCGNVEQLASDTTK
jgi:hypothetical protein